MLSGRILITCSFCAQYPWLFCDNNLTRKVPVRKKVWVGEASSELLSSPNSQRTSLKFWEEFVNLKVTGSSSLTCSTAKTADGIGSSDKGTGGASHLQ